MATAAGKTFEFGPYRLDSAERVLLRDGRPVPLTLKSFDVLLLLVENSGHIVEKDELMNRVWGGSFVEEGNLKVTVSMVRKALEDNQNGNRYVETVPRRGYRFVADVRVLRETVPRDEVGTVDEEAVVQPPGAGQPRQGAIQPKLAWFMASVLVLAGLAAIVFLSVTYIRPTLTANESAPPFSRFKMMPVTTSGRSSAATISPDGKYVAYAALDGTQRSLWLRHLSTVSDVPIHGPVDLSFAGLKFSPSGDHIYYVAGARNIPNTLYDMPVLGRTPRKLVTDIDSSVTLSPDAKHLAFVRGYPPRREAYVIVANADGTGERKLATHHIGELFLMGPSDLGPSWSPDGEMIAFGFRDDRVASGASVMAVRVKDGQETPIVSGPWQTIGPIHWLRDGLVFIAAEQDGEPNGQIWYVSYPGGKLRRITNDLHSYQSLSLSSDSSALVTIQYQQISNLWTTSNGPDDATQISSSKYDGIDGLAWTPDGRVVYVSRASGQSQIWITKADGTDKKQLTFDPSWKGRLSVSRDGRYVVFGSGRSDISHIWRMDIDGGNEVQLSRGRENRGPHVTFDSRWVVYTSFDSDTPTLWKVPITGGEPIQLTKYQSTALAIGPHDGQIAYAYDALDEGSRLRRKTALLPLSGGMPARTLGFVVPPNARWAPDGQALTYVEARAGVANIWRRPLDGSLPQQVTNFTSSRIFRHDWSADGKRLALARGSWTSDVVLIRDLANVSRIGER